MLFLLFVGAAHTVPLTNLDGRPYAAGVLVNPWQVLTAAHAVAELHSTVFIGCEGEQAAGRVTKRSRVHDLALVTLFQACRKVPSVELGDSEPENGDELVMEGYPGREYAKNQVVMQGHQLFAIRDTRNGSGLFWLAMTIQGDVRPGNSGGPILTKFGKLCGIVHGYSEASPGKPGVVVPLPAIMQFLTVEEPS